MNRPQRPSAYPPQNRVRAAADLGTNSFHLVVAVLDAHGRFEVLDTEKEMVRLGSGSGDMSRLTSKAMDRGIETLRRFSKVAESFGADLTAVATSALREAKNREVFLQRARDEAGVEIQVISGVEEARLIHLGVLQALPVFDEQILVVDVGGGSTEFVVGQGRDVKSAHSTKLGAIRLTDRFFADGVLTPKAVRKCRTHVRSFLVPTIRRVRRFRPFLTVGSSGTVSTVARMIVAARGGDPMAPINGAQFSRAELAGVVDNLLAAPTPSERAQIAGLDEKRRDIIVAGALLLEQIFDGLEIERMTVSEAALREGVLLDLLAREGEPSFHHLNDIRRQSVLRTADTYHEDVGHVQRATDVSLQIFDQLVSLHQLDFQSRDLLEAAAMLHNVGLFISHAAHHKHSYYVIRHSDQLAGFTDREIELIAQIARYHRKSEPKPSHADFQALEAAGQACVRTLAGILRIGIALDRTRRGWIDDLEVAIGKSVVNIRVGVASDVDYSLEQYTAEQRAGMLANALGRTVKVEFRVGSNVS
ncbi:MAG: HD domain-containing protein [Acidimicrobiales bacterium]